MDTFISHLIDHLELSNFGFSHEDLVPITCDMSIVSLSNGKIELTSRIMKFLFPRGGKFYGMTPNETREFQKKVRDVIDLYWNDISYETKIIKNTGENKGLDSFF